MTKVTDGSKKKGSKAKEERRPSVEEKESAEMKTETEKEAPPAEEVPETQSEEQEARAAKGVPRSDEPQEEQKGEVSDTESDEAAAPVEVSAEERVEQLAKENEELQDKFVRLMADFENYRKRASKEKSDVIQFGNEGLLKDFLPIVDNIERLLTYSYGESSWKSFQEGIELLLSEIGKTLEKYGVEPIEALGKPFDPNIHEAMQRAETEEVEANTVLEVYQKGYLYRGRLLRPSLVVVAVPPQEAGEGEEKEDAPATDASSPEAGDAEAEGTKEETPIN